MENKLFKIINENSDYEYDVKVIEENSKTTIKLFYSNSDIWSSNVKGKKTLTLIDDGNSIAFKPKLKKELNYEQANYVRMLLALNEKLDNIKNPNIPMGKNTVLIVNKLSTFII
jgi:hypothetical protein